MHVNSVGNLGDHLVKLTGLDWTTGWSILLDGASIRRGGYDGCSKTPGVFQYE